MFGVCEDEVIHACIEVSDYMGAFAIGGLVILGLSYWYWLGDH